MRSLGAVPQVTAFSDVYQALRTGFVDGTENPHSNFYTQKMYEVQKHITITEHGYLGYAVIANKKFWDNLPRSIRTQVWQAMNEATDYANLIAREENDTALARIIETGKTRVYTPTPAERLELKKAMIKTHREMAHRIGQDKPVFVYKLITEDTVEEKILKLQEKKQMLANGLYSDAGAQEGVRFSSEDLMDLLKPLEQ